MARRLQACCVLYPRAAKVDLSFHGRINGDKGCAANRIGPNSYQEEYGMGSYEMNCAAWRDQGICE